MSSIVRSSTQTGGRYTLVPGSNGSDDTTAIQAALNVGGEIVFRAGGAWTIAGGNGVFPVSNSRIIIEAGASIAVATNALDTYRLFNVSGVHDVRIEGAGSLVGDLLTHTGTTGQFGHLIYITNGCADIQVTGPLKLKYAWGDGIYIGGTAGSARVLVDGVTVDDVRREGISAFWGSDITLRNCTIKNIGVTASSLSKETGPASGIDVEPNSTDSIAGLVIDSCTITGNRGPGIYISPNSGPITNIELRNNRVDSCGVGGTSLVATYAYPFNGIHVASVTRPLLFDNVVLASAYDNNVNGASGGIYLRGTQRALVQGGYIRNNRGRGIFTTSAPFTEITGVTVQENDRQGITLYQSDDSIVDRCYLLDNIAVPTTTPHLMMQTSARIVSRGNVFRGNKGTYWTRVYSDSTDSVVLNNLGLGTAPTTAAYVDEGVTTYTSGNITKTAGGTATW